MWPPDGREWQSLLQRLPADADRAGLRAMVLAAVREYAETADRGRDLQLLRTLVSSRNYQKLRYLRRRLADVPSGQLQQWIAAELDNETVKALAVAYQPSTRRERLLSTLSLAWTGPGRGELTISETGPFTDFISEIAARVLVPPITGSGVKAFARREKVRRAALTIINEVWGIRSGMKVDAFVVNAAGQRLG